MRKIRVAFAGLYQDDNLGDPVIAKCTEAMYLDGIPSELLEIKHISLNHYYKNQLSYRMLWWLRISKWIKMRKKFFDCILTSDYIRLMDKELAKFDVVIIVGGGLIEFNGNRFTDGMYGIALAGNKYGFPVIINGVGVEGYDPDNVGCQKLKKMLKQPSIKYISTRDDYDTLFMKYFDGKPNTICEKVADPAVWASEVFKVKRKGNSNEIGVGVIRSNIFEDYNLEFSAEELKSLYVDIILLLLKEGFTVRIFTNGTEADNSFANLIQSEIKTCYGINLDVDIPNSALSLVKTIAQFKGIIAGRLHSCIISYSLNIPAVGLVWNKKLLLFGKNIKEECNFILPKDFTALKIVEQLKKSIVIGYDQELRCNFRSTIKDSIEKNKKEYIISKLADGIARS